VASLEKINKLAVEAAKASQEDDITTGRVDGVWGLGLVWIWWIWFRFAFWVALDELFGFGFCFGLDLDSDSGLDSDSDSVLVLDLVYLPFSFLPLLTPRHPESGRPEAH
jgi:hypothetical protein